MNNGYEYYYLFGLDIPLEEFGLGVIKQPKIRDFLSKDIEIENFYASFITIDFLVENSKDKSLVKLRDEFGRFALFIHICQQTNNFSNINDLISKINFLYGVDNAELNELGIVVGDVIINSDNFDKLCDVVLEMCKIDKSKIKFEQKPEYDNRVISDKMLEAKRRFLELNKGKNKKDDSLSILDVANIVIHSKDISYQNILDMTMYQLKNSFEVLNIKESFDVSTLYRVSPKFDMSKEKYQHWTEKVKINKSRLAD